VKAYRPWNDIYLDSTERTHCWVSIVTMITRTRYSVTLHIYLLSRLDLDSPILHCGPVIIIMQATLAEEKVESFSLFRTAQILARIVCHLVSIWNDHNINPLKTKRRLPYLKAQFVPRCKHFSTRL
jgi:hypothetical protein